MELRMWNSWSLPLIIFLVLVCLANPVVPAIFVFGDSTTDVGTNNYLPVHNARADYPFNGIDFHGGKPTGRFSNGYNIADTLARVFGYQRSPPAFLSLLYDRGSLFQRDIFWGANFASGGAGLLNTTGLQFGKIVSMADQIQQFGTVCNNITQLMAEAGKTAIAKSIIVISMGSNDIFDYFEFNETRNQEKYIVTLMQSYQIHLTNLLNLGARKFAIVSMPPLGCLPRFRVFNTTGGCIDEMNSYALMFHSELKGMLQNLSSEHTEMKYSLGNSYDMTIDIMANPLGFRFKDTISACCGAGIIGAQSNCLPNATVCQNRDEHFWWDRYHLSQHGYEVAALTLYGGATKYVEPMNFSQLVEVDV